MQIMSGLSCNIRVRSNDMLAQLGLLGDNRTCYPRRLVPHALVQAPIFSVLVLWLRLGVGL